MRSANVVLPASPPRVRRGDTVKDRAGRSLIIEGIAATVSGEWLVLVQDPWGRSLHVWPEDIATDDDARASSYADRAATYAERKRVWEYLRRVVRRLLSEGKIKEAQLAATLSEQVITGALGDLVDE